MHLARFPRLRFAHLPTPLEPMPNLTRLLGGPQLYVKRDDCTGLATGGNKTRKLEFLIADALAQGADTVITHGAVQSNHVRQTAAAAGRYGLKCAGLLERRVPGHGPEYEVTGNVLLDHLFRAEVRFVAAGTDMDGACAELAEEIRGRGGKPYYIPGGGSNAVGALGYVDAALELLPRPTPWACASTGGPRQRQHRDTKRPGLRARGRELGDRRARHLRQPAGGGADRCGVPNRERDGRTRRHQGRAGPRRASWRTATTSARATASRPQGRSRRSGSPPRHEGLLLDPVYTGKAMAGLIALCRQGFFTPARTSSSCTPAAPRRCSRMRGNLRRPAEERRHLNTHGPTICVKLKTSSNSLRRTALPARSVYGRRSKG